MARPSAEMLERLQAIVDAQHGAHEQKAHADHDLAYWRSEIEELLDCHEPKPRVVWRVVANSSPSLYNPPIIVEPVEQAPKLTKKAGWTRGRLIRWDSLARLNRATDLDPEVPTTLTAELSAAERRRYEDARLAAMTSLADADGDTGKDKRFQVLAALTKLRQLACHPRLVDASWKLSSAKRDLVAGILDGTDQAGKLSTRELIDLIALGSRRT